MPIVDAYGRGKKQAVMDDTWGHTYPSENSKHAGYMLVAYTDYRESVVLHDAFDLCDSPLKYELIHSIWQHKITADLDAGVYRIDCTLWFLKGLETGSIIKCKIKRIVKFEEES